MHVLDDPNLKYHRTFHVPWSPHILDKIARGKEIVPEEDRVLESVAHFINRPIIIFEKMDGENQCMTNEVEGYYARTHSAKASHISNNWGKAIHGSVRHLIDAWLSVFSEYCYAYHSIVYTHLPSYLLVFGVRDDRQKLWWAWDDVELMAAHLGLPTVPVLWRGVVTSEKELMALTNELARQPSAYGPEREGVIIKIADAYTDPNVSVAKWVRAGHVKADVKDGTVKHWKRRPVIKQGLAS